MAGDAPLCVDCYSKIANAWVEVRNAEIQAARHSMAMANHALAEMESVTGLFGLNPRIQIPQMPSTGPITLNNIKLDNSTVAVLNTGNIRDIDASVGELRRGGNESAAGALRNLTQAVATDYSMTVHRRMNYWTTLRS